MESPSNNLSFLYILPNFRLFISPPFGFQCSCRYQILCKDKLGQFLLCLCHTRLWLQWPSQPVLCFCTLPLHNSWHNRQLLPTSSYLYPTKVVATLGYSSTVKQFFWPDCFNKGTLSSNFAPENLFQVICHGGTALITHK